MRVPLAALALAILLLLAPPGRAQDAPLAAPDREAIARVITGQIEAFRHDDAAGAFAFAAPSIKAIFGDADTFLGMVRRGYPPVYRPRSFQMGQLSTTDGQIVQRVEIVGPDGKPALALYSMERGADGVWRISGCQLTESELIGA